MEMKYPHLFEPLKVGKTIYRNRIFASATGFQNGSQECRPNADMAAYYELKAKGGAAAVTLGSCLIDPNNARSSLAEMPFYDRTIKGQFAEVGKAITRHGAIASAQLQHAGMYARVSGEMNGFVYGPSATEIPFRPGGSPQTKATDQMLEVREMTDEMIEQTIEAFADGAAFAQYCGFGQVQIHGGHGWLLGQFMSPYSNHRTDKWGGSLENRMRFPLAILDAIRKKCGRDLTIEFRMSGDELHDGGYHIDEGIAMAKMLDGRVDLLQVSAGHHEVPEIFFVMHPSMFCEDGNLVQYAAAIKKEVNTPVGCVAGLTSPDMMEEIIASGQADYVNLARQMFADPYLPWKARTGRDDEIRQCMRCYSCFSECDHSRHFMCAINPVIGSELETKIPVKANTKKKVLVAGGGIAGMQAALQSAEAGHEVVLVEKSDHLGGVLVCEKDVPFKKKLHTYLQTQIHMVEKKGIDVRLNTEANAELAKELKPDVIIAAMGAHPAKLRLPGVDLPHVYGAIDIYKDAQKAGEKVVILGGGLVGVELSIYLSILGKKVTILEMADHLNFGHEGVHGGLLMMKLPEYGVDVRLNCKAKEITETGVVYETAEGTETVEADTVTYAVGQISEWEKADELRMLAPEFYQVGDCSKPRNIMSANQEAYFSVRDMNELF